MESIHKDGLLSRTLIKKINDYLSKNSFKENIKTEKKVIMTPDGSVCMVHERYFIIDNCNETIYLDTLDDVLNYILENNQKGELMEIKIKKLNKEATIPTCATEGSAGYDLYSLNEKVMINSNESYLFDTGIAIEIPNGYVGLIFARSGLASKLGLAPSTKVSVIDSDYRGDIRVSLFNHSKSAVFLEEKTRIAQLVIVPYLSCNFVEVEELEETERGTNGFGSTGTK